MIIGLCFHKLLFWRFRESLNLSHIKNGQTYCKIHILTLSLPSKKFHLIKSGQEKSTYQSNRLNVFELDVGDAFEPARLVAKDEANVPDLADRWEELLNVSCSASLGQLHHEDGTSVTFLRRQDNLGWAFTYRSLLTRRAGAATVSGPENRNFLFLEWYWTWKMSTTKSILRLNTTPNWHRMHVHGFLK